MARLRAALDPSRTGDAVIQTAAPGYRLVVGRADLDANMFVDLVRQAREAAERGEPVQAETYVDEALALWRGAPYAEFADSEYFATEVRRLTEVRLAGLDVGLAAGLAQGRHAELVVEAEALCADYPLREGFWVHLVIALYRCGRQADALAALRRVRTLLADEIGADPSVELQGLEQRVLHQDPTLVAPGRPEVGLPPLPPELDPAGRLFVGRSDELAWLRRVWSEVAARGDARLLAIAGPTGSGRTRLLGEFAAELHAQGIAVHYGGLGVGLALLDDLDDRAVAFLHAVGGAGPMLCVAAYDPSRASPLVRRALIETAAEERLLPPLSRDEVAQIVVNIGGTVDADLVEEIAAAAEGWPSAVERLTMEVIGQRSAQRVAAAADRAGPASRTLTAATGRGRRRRSRADPGTVVAGGGTARYGPARLSIQGARRVRAGDAPLFHGREDLVAALCARLVDTAFVAVVGPSGAGKSSLVRAGLLPALADGVLP